MLTNQEIIEQLCEAEQDGDAARAHMELAKSCFKLGDRKKGMFHIKKAAPQLQHTKEKLESLLK